MAKDSHPQSVAQRMLGLVEGDGRDDPALARDGRRTAPAQRLQILNQSSFQYTVPYTSINSPGRKKIVLNAKTVARSPILRTPIWSCNWLIKRWLQSNLIKPLLILKRCMAATGTYTWTYSAKAFINFYSCPLETNETLVCQILINDEEQWFAEVF